jgi:hypothetical protein
MLLLSVLLLSVGDGGYNFLWATLIGVASYIWNLGMLKFHVYGYICSMLDLVTILNFRHLTYFSVADFYIFQWGRLAIEILRFGPGELHEAWLFPAHFMQNPLSQPNTILCSSKFHFNYKSIAMGSWKIVTQKALRSFCLALDYLSSKIPLVKTWILIVPHAGN